MDVISDNDLAALAAASPYQPSARSLFPETEFEALMYVLRDGATALSRPDVMALLARTSERQLQQAVRRLTRRSPSNAAPWKPGEIRSLKEIAKARR